MANNDHMVNSGSHSNDGFLQAHHMMDDPELPPPKINPFMYFNFFAENQSIVDYSYLVDLCNIQLNVAIMKERLQMSGTLAGLMTGIGIQAPSVIAVMIALSMINIELSSSMSSVSSNYQKSVIASIADKPNSMDATVVTNYSKDREYQFRQISLDKPEDSQRIYLTKKQLFNSVGTFLATFLLFDQTRKLMPATDVKNPRYYYQVNAAYNIACTLFHTNMCYPISYIRSFANYIGPLLLQVNTTKCLRERGSYYNIKYYVAPVIRYDKNIHNVLFRNSFPRFNTKPNEESSINNYIPLCYRYLFYSQFSNLPTVHKFSEILRKTSPSYEEFNDYIFDLTNVESIEGMSPLITKIGQDSLTTIINNVERKDLDTSYDEFIYKLYEEIVALAKYSFKFFSDYLNLIRSSNNCTFKGEYPLTNEDADEIDKIVKSITSIIVPSERATISIGPIINHTSQNIEGYDKTVGYKILAPIMGSSTDNGNLVSGFITFYARSVADVQIRQYSIKNVYSDKLEEMGLALKEKYDQDKGLIEQVPPDQEWQKLLRYAENANDGSIECVKDYLQIPSILGDIITEQSMRGKFIKI